jgi:hypothetical protein
MDARQVFDDLPPHVLARHLGNTGEFGDQEPAQIVDMAGATLRVLDRMQLKTKLPVKLVGTDVDSTTFQFDHDVVGVDTLPSGTFPIYDVIRERYRFAIGRPKLVRVDGEASYKQFREERQQEQSVQPVYLARRNAACWVDGDEVVCTVRVSDNMVATTGESLDDSFRAVVGAAESTGCRGADALLLGVALSPMVAGYRLLGDVINAKDALCDEGVGFVGALVPQTSVELAALMTLIQRCQGGDRKSCREVLSMSRAGHGDQVRDAANRLVRAQQKKLTKPRASSWWSRLWS